MAPIVEHRLDVDDVAQIVHDVRGPLSTILLEAQLMGKLMRASIAALPAVRRIAHNIAWSA
jgi:signal transduction histidine kinase